ncbi:hypothetical protein MSAN_01021200 [Mycena sanguinolenta]|uniref:Uncharacterized protein n=1 Tax=Mycena sanguinolenta TaxID=230812 RepID=A0A8H7D6X6_9AGAR|nr:hypothetical protein MSAN_01021200 [Mycena sanguinolenta]
MLDKLPPEICAHIFDLACRDSAGTGRSLSLVSRYIHETSELARYTSITLVGCAQVVGFAQFAEHTHIELKTRHLFINTQESEEELQRVVLATNARLRLAELKYEILVLEGDVRFSAPSPEKLQDAKDAIALESAKVDALLGTEVAIAVETILRRLGPTLEILDIAVNEYVAKMLLNPISLPHLVDLTTRCGFPLRRGSVPALEPTPSLRYLHIVDTTLQWHRAEQFYENGISYFAPSLTHLRLSELYEDEVVITHLERALGLVPSNKYSLKATQLPPTIERVLLKPIVAPSYDEDGCPCCDETRGYRNLVKFARRLRDKDHRVVLLNADRIPPAEDLYLQEWRNKADGAACDWDTSDLDLESSQVARSGSMQLWPFF